MTAVFLGLPGASPTTELAGKSFPAAAGRALGDAQLRRNLGNATSTIRAKRAAVVAEVPDWEQLRAAGAAIIRCSACLNVCPVYERTGGHAYGSVYPGPIGAVLSPQLTGVAANPSLPFASTLCGACFDVCPVAIDIPTMLVHLRSRVVEEGGHPVEAAAMRTAAFVMRSPSRWTRALRLLRVGRLLARRGRIRRLPLPLSRWTAARDLPPPPSQTFRDWWAAR